MKKKFNRLYIHVPFCQSKCGYCAFYSIADADNSLVDRYLQKLAADLECDAKNCNQLQSIYLGGGTPTWLSACHLSQLFSHIRSHFSIAKDAEISIECNPESLTKEKAAVIGSFCNRVSLGVQSFTPSARQLLTRQGDVDTIHTALELLGRHNFSNIGIDLIYAVPGQTLSDWQQELQQALTLGISHLSCYSLTVEEGTRLAQQEIDEATLNKIGADMWQTTGEILGAGGIQRYEISNYARPGFECAHNVEIWYGDSYLGLGPAASSFDGIKRWTQPADLAAWLEGSPAELDTISAEERAREVLIMGLRTIPGWQRDTFEQRTGFSWERWQDNINHLVNDGLLEQTLTVLKPTAQGLLFWDEIGMELI